MSEKEESGNVDASSRLLNGEKQISVVCDLDKTARPTKNKETAKQLTIVEKESKYRWLQLEFVTRARKSYSRPQKVAVDKKLIYS